MYVCFYVLCMFLCIMYVCTVYVLCVINDKVQIQLQSAKLGYAQLFDEFAATA